MRALSMAVVFICCTAMGSPWRLFAQAPTLKPGEYELTTELTTANSPAKMPARKDLHCYTAQEVQDLAARLGSRGNAQGCKAVSSKMTGSTLAFMTECGAPTTITTTGTVTFTSAESYHAVVTMKDSSGRADNPILSGSMTMNITAKRIGDCKK